MKNPYNFSKRLEIKGDFAELKRFVDMGAAAVPYGLLKPLEPFMLVTKSDPADLGRQVTPDEMQRITRRELITEVDFLCHGNPEEFKQYILKHFKVTVASYA